MSAKLIQHSTYNFSDLDFSDYSFLILFLFFSSFSTLQTFFFCTFDQLKIANFTNDCSLLLDKRLPEQTVYTYHTEVLIPDLF